VDNSIFLLKTISDVFTAGGAITAFSLLFYVITFQIKDIVTRSFTFLLACIVLILGTDAFFTTTSKSSNLVLLLQVQFVGLILLPAAYFYFSNALLTITGKPSEGKRIIFGLVTLVIAAIFIGLNFSGNLFENIAISNFPVPNIQRTRPFDFFSIYFLIVMATVWYNFFRALNRTASTKSRRRMLYLVVAAIGPALGSFPYLLYGLNIIHSYPSIFWMISIIAYFVISTSIVVMTYTVSFFGLPWPDRVIKSRLFKWLMRGPVTAILTLGVTTFISRLAVQNNVDLSSIQILGMVATIVVFEFSVTIFSPYWERLLFSGAEKNELEKIRQLENRLLTKNDLQQFLELILATFCDLLQVENAAMFILNQEVSSLISKIGSPHVETGKDDRHLMALLQESDFKQPYVHIVDNLIFPISDQSEEQEILGYISCSNGIEKSMSEETVERLKRLLERASIALIDRRQQEDIFDSLDVFTPQLSALQSLLASSRFNRTKIFDENGILESDEFEKFIKDALNHFFGGPHLSKSPLIQLGVVQNRVKENSEPAIKALRSVIHIALERLKPKGERQYTNEWLLYNILELKYIQGWKVRELCRKLALSEADFYRKQRIAIRAIADQLFQLEQEFNQK